MYITAKEITICDGGNLFHEKCVTKFIVMLTLTLTNTPNALRSKGKVILNLLLMNSAILRTWTNPRDRKINAHFILAV